MANISAVDLGGMSSLAAAHQTAIDSQRVNLNLLLSQAQNLAPQYSGEAASRLLSAVDTLHDRGMSLLQAHQTIQDLVATTRGRQSTTNDNTIAQSGQVAGIADAAPSGLPGL